MSGVLRPAWRGPAAVLLGLALPLPASGQPVDVAPLDDIMREALAAWQVPGTALAVVHRDKVVYLKGFGVRDVGTKLPVTADTVFPIASCTKSFTAHALALLVDEGKLDWDDPVRK